MRALHLSSPLKKGAVGAVMFSGVFAEHWQLSRKHPLYFSLVNACEVTALTC